MKIRVESASENAKLCQSNRTGKRIELAKQLTAFSFEKQLTWRKLLIPFSLLVTISADSFLVTIGRTINYLFYDAIRNTREEPAQSSPKIQFYIYS